VVAILENAMKVVMDDDYYEEYFMADDQAPIVTVPKAAAPDRGSVGEQIQREWAVLREWFKHGSALTTKQLEAIRKLDELIGYDGGKS
jgi:hypothetical protein